MEQLPPWLRQTKRLFPHPLFAGCISLACLMVGILFAGSAIAVNGAWPMGILSIVFFLGCYATAAAAMTRSERKPASTQREVQANAPTFAIFVLLIGVYTWLMTIAMHVFHAFFRNGPGSIKYYITLGIPISATLFMQFYGKKVVRTHFGSMGGRNLELNGRQAIYVTLFVVSLGIYATWLML